MDINSIIELYRKAACDIPKDIEAALKEAAEKEEELPKKVLSTILKNIDIAKESNKPMCQDTGTPIFFVKHKVGRSQKEIKETVQKATDIATKEVPLRTNAVDPLTSRTLGNKPIIHFEQSDQESITLMLKGGGSENITAIYSLPNNELKADRNLKGVQKCILDAVNKAQGKGCPPYIIGAAIGGVVEDVIGASKKQLLRKVLDKNKDPILQELEKNTLEKINQLGIGPLGLGGKTTALTVKIASHLRHPASYFVAVTFGCWAMRRHSI